MPVFSDPPHVAHSSSSVPYSALYVSCRLLLAVILSSCLFVWLLVSIKIVSDSESLILRKSLVHIGSQIFVERKNKPRLFYNVRNRLNSLHFRIFGVWNCKDKYLSWVKSSWIYRYLHEYFDHGFFAHWSDIMISCWSKLLFFKYSFLLKHFRRQ